MKYLKGLNRSAFAGLVLGAAMAQAAGIEAVPGEFVIKLKSGAVRSMTANKRLSAMGFRNFEKLGAGDTFLVKAPNVSETELNTMSDDIEYVEPNYIYRASSLGVANEVDANDARFDEQWGLKNVGQSVGESGTKSGKAGADSAATLAWAKSKGSSDVVVAVVDTGIDYTHPDLAGNMWTKPGTSDEHGYNAVTDEADPMDDNDHGTHCAGVIGASSNNKKGIAGINWNASLMGVKFLTASGSGSLATAIKAINYAADNGARVISASWGGGGFSRALQDAIAQAGEKGVIFVAAAGNDGSDNDARPTYPAGFKLDNIVAVAAHDQNDELADFSNFGLETVHLAAPGVDILSTLTGGRYGFLSGTSMATPHVAGAAALLLSVEPELTAVQIKERLVESVTQGSAYDGKAISGGRLNLAKLIGAAE